MCHSGSVAPRRARVTVGTASPFVTQPGLCRGGCKGQDLPRGSAPGDFVLMTRLCHRPLPVPELPGCSPNLGPRGGALCLPMKPNDFIFLIIVN